MWKRSTWFCNKLATFGSITPATGENVQMDVLTLKQRAASLLVPLGPRSPALSLNCCMWRQKKKKAALGKYTVWTVTGSEAYPSPQTSLDQNQNKVTKGERRVTCRRCTAPWSQAWKRRWRFCYISDIPQGPFISCGAITGMQHCINHVAVA